MTIPNTNSTATINITEFTINIGTICVEIDKSRPPHSRTGIGAGTGTGTRLGGSTTPPTTGPSIVVPTAGPTPTPTPTPTPPITPTTLTPTFPSTNAPTDDPNLFPIFPDHDVSDTIENGEVLLGQDVSTQGSGGVGVGTGLIISSFTYQIEAAKQKVSTPLQVVTFIIRGSGFDVTSGITELAHAGGLGTIFEPKVVLGNIPLKVVKFSNTYIEARFDDVNDQQSFVAGTYLVRVKVLHSGTTPPATGTVDIPDVIKLLRKGPLGFPLLPITVETKGPFDLDPPQLSLPGSDSGSTSSSAPPLIGGLTLPQLQGLPSFEHSHSLASLFDGLIYDVTSLSVIFTSDDANKISKAARVVA